MVENKLLQEIEKGNWVWSWNGSCPYYLLEPLFLEPTKLYLEKFHSIKLYAILSKDHGKEISAYLVSDDKKIEEESRKYLDANAGKYIKGYAETIKKTEKVVESYKIDVRDARGRKINAQDWQCLSNLLIKNIEFYLISQPEITSSLGKELLVEINKNCKDPEEAIKIVQEVTQPKRTILARNASELNKIAARIKTEKDLDKKEIREEIFDYYWKYRSFYMMDLSGSIEREFQRVLDAVIELKNKKKETASGAWHHNEYNLSQKARKLAGQIKEIGALRLEGKNAWLNLCLLIINVFDFVSRQAGIDGKELANYHFHEVSELLEKNFAGSMPLAKRKTSAFVMSSEKIHEFNEGDAKKIIELIVKPIKKASSVTGTVAYHGKVEGTAFIIKAQDSLSKKIKEIIGIKNPILVAEQTIPAYLPLIDKACGIITNEGGILSHAAIVAREFKKPALIGTKQATLVFKTGDKIILDTEKKIACKERC